MLAALGVELRLLRRQRELTLHELAELVGYSHQHLGAVERAQVVPSEAVMAACDRALTGNGRLVTMLAAVIREQAHVRQRNQQTRRARRTASGNQPRTPQSVPPEGLADGSDVDWERLADAGRRASPVTQAAVEDLEQITDRQRRLYHDLASAEMLTHVQAQLGLLDALLGNQPTGPLRHRIASAAAEAAGFAAWLWFDLGDWFSTQRNYRHATQAVGEAGDTGLGSYLQGYQALIATQTNSPRAAAEHLAYAVDTAPRSLSGTTRSWLAILNAEAMAHIGQTKAASRAIVEAQELLTQPRPDGADPWMYDFDQGSLAAHSGRCHLALEQPMRAIEAFTEALRLLPPGCDRRKARIQLGLARAHLSGGDADEALRQASAALSTFAHRGSTAGLRGVHHVRDTFLEAGLPTQARALDEQARSLRHAAG